MPPGLVSLTFGGFFNRSLDAVLMPSSLRQLTFGEAFNQPLERTQLPHGLQVLIFGRSFNQALAPRRARGALCDRSEADVKLPSGLKQLSFGFDFDQSLEEVCLGAREMGHGHVQPFPVSARWS